MAATQAQKTSIVETFVEISFRRNKNVCAFTTEELDQAAADAYAFIEANTAGFRNAFTGAFASATNKQKAEMYVQTIIEIAKL